MTHDLPIGFKNITAPQEVETDLVLALMSDASRLRAFSHITPEAFTDPVAKHFWAIMQRLVRDGDAVSPEAVAGKIGNDEAVAEKLTSTGKSVVQVLIDAACFVRADHEIKILADIVVDRYMRRQAVAVGDMLRIALCDIGAGEDAAAVLGRYADELNRIASSTTVSKPTDFAEICRGTAERGMPFERIGTGYKHLDDALSGGLIKPGVVVFQGKAKSFKTGAMLSVAFQLAKRKVRSCYLSLEMPGDQLALRLIAADDVTNTANYLDYPDRLKRAAAKCGEKFPDVLDFVDLPGASLGQVQAAAWRAVNHGAEVVFLDYFQLVTGRQHGETMVDHLERVGTWCQSFASQANIALVVAAQIGRSGETYGSAALERNCSCLIQLHRANGHSDRVEREMLWLDVRLNRHGRSGPFGDDDRGVLEVGVVGPILKPDAA